MFALILFTFAANGMAKAAGGALSVNVKIDSQYIYRYNDNYYLSQNGKNVTLKYVIKNSSSETIKLSAIRIVETLSGSEDNLYGEQIYADGITTIAPGAMVELTGKNFSFDNSDDFVFQYDIRVVYTHQDEFGMDIPYTDDDFQSILADNDNGIIYITRENVSFESEYNCFQSDDNIYPGDSVMLSVKLTSNSNVPIKNVKVYDSVHGLIGEIALIQPGETVELNADITVRYSAQSYPYINYSSLDNASNGKIDFELSFINIAVSKHDYRLALEIQCENLYISKNQLVEVKFITTNLGSGVIEDINIIGEDGNTVFTIESLDSGEIFEKVVSLNFSPNTTYTYNCISPLTTEVRAMITFLSLPGLSLSYDFDKDIIQYKYFDIVSVSYSIENKGSVDAKDLVISDGGQVYSVGIIGKGEKRTVTMNFTLTSAETVFSPILTGIYEDGTLIEENGIETIIYVETPADYADIEFSAEVSPNPLYAGGIATITYTLKNNGTGSLTSYSVLIVEKNMVIASEGVLQAGQSKTFSTVVVINDSQSLTFRVSGKNGEDGTVYEKDSSVTVEVIPEETISPMQTPLPSDTLAPAPVPSDNENGAFKFVLVVIFAIGIVSILMIIITLAVVFRKYLGKR